MTSDVCLWRRRVQGWLAAICFVLGRFLTHTTLRERLSLHRLAQPSAKTLVPNVWGAVTPHMRKQAQGEKVSPKPDGISGRLRPRDRARDRKVGLDSKSAAIGGHG